MARRKQVQENIKITGIADKGMAVGRDDEGMVYFVQGAVPGDIVDVLVLRKKSSFKKGIVYEYKSYSPERIEAKCLHFGVCGGCKWQNLDYTSQVKYKEQTVKDVFKRLAHIEPEEFRSLLSCNQIFEYRNKMEYSFSQRRWATKEELASDEIIEFGPAVGLHPPGAFDKVVQIDKCWLQDDLSNDIRNYLHELAQEKSWTYYDSKLHKGFLRNLRIRNSTLGEWMVLMIFGEKNDKDIFILLDMLSQKFPQITSLHYVINEKMNDSIHDLNTIHYKGEEGITEQLSHLKYRFGPKSFFQTNSYQAVKLFDLIVELADFKGTETVYDLYTGLGSIALYIAKNCKKVIGIEEIKEAIEDAEINKKINNVQNAYFEVGDVKDQFNDVFVEKYGKADLIIVDPPRAGLHKDVCEMLNKTAADRIIYVSCNPSTQARDIMLMPTYKIKVLQAVDMFPHTHHIENVVLLEKK